VIDGLSILRPEYIVLLKAKAWLDLTARRENGETVKSDDIKKHKNDPFRLFTILSPELRVDIAEEIRADFGRYLEAMTKETVDLQNLGIRGMKFNEVVSSFRLIYGIEES